MVCREKKLGPGALFSNSVSLGTCSRKVIVVAKCQSHTPPFYLHIIQASFCWSPIIVVNLQQVLALLYQTHINWYTHFFFNSVSFLHSTDNPKLHLVMLQTSALKSSWEFKQIKCTREKSEIKKSLTVWLIPHINTLIRGSLARNNFVFWGTAFNFSCFRFCCFESFVVAISVFILPGVCSLTLLSRVHCVDVIYRQARVD